jgi:hypothetical protein
MTWPFNDPPDRAVYTRRRIVSSEDWIDYVSHDAADGAWQFHSPGPASEEDGVIVSLREILDLDPSIADLADLPPGWCARREGRDAAWRRRKG